MDLTPTDLAALSRYLDDLLDVEAARRDAWFASLPDAHRHLERMLRQMLDERDKSRTSGFMAALPAIGDDRGEHGDAPMADALVGPYRLIREIGRGGMGSVWLAQRSDGVLKREIALKLPHAALGARHFADRLARERDILSSLAHPNIARLYDAGVTPQGQPYLALAYVQGQTLIEHCDAQRLGVRQRVELFQQVLGAVQYAHAHLVIHRDIKPSNVLVDEQGQVQLLDFGIAKLMVDGQPESSALTLDGSRMMTPDYASPEQISGDLVGTASDVYSLGVLLYELLAGERPYRLKSELQHGLAHAIMATDPSPPSTAANRETAASRRGTDTESLAKALRGDLDAIVLKALQKPTALRYGTAEAMRLDLQRYLDGEAVLAQPYNAAYRVRKFIGRHRLPAAFAAAAVVALAIGAGVATWQAQVAGRERDNALRLLARNEAVSEFLNLFITEAAQSPNPLSATELLARSEALAEGAFRKQPEHRALVLSILGGQMQDVDDLVKAEALMTRAVDAAHDSNDVSFKTRLACKRAIIQVTGGHKEATEILLSEAHRAGVDPATAAECYDALSLAALLRVDGAAAVGYSRQALDLFKQSSLGSPAKEAEFVERYAYALHLSGHNEDADREFAHSLDIYTRLGREDSTSAITMLSNWATMNNNAGDARAALALYDKIAATLDKRGVGDTPPAPQMLAYGARAMAINGRSEAAARQYARALAAAEKVDDPGSAFVCLLGQATAALDAEHIDDAEQLLRRMESLKTEGSYVARGLHFLRARIAQARGRAAEARREYDATVAIARTVPNTVVALTRRGDFSLEDGRLDDALKDARTAFGLATTLQGGKPYSVHTGSVALLEGRILAKQGDAAGAHKAYELALLHLSHTVDDSHPGLRRAREFLGSGTK